MDVADWLRGLGLGQYEAAFHENSVTVDLLPSLTLEDLRDLGITAVGHRRRLLDAIAALRADRDLARGRSSDVQTAGPAHDDRHRSLQSAAERRRISVMFCDVVGFTTLSSHLDPEDLSEVIRAYQACVARTIARFDGFIARYVGDGVLIYFGWPEARETDAERAVRAALAVITEIGRAPISREKVRVRIGIATGLVVVGEPIGTGEARQQTAIGETPNLAARLQGLAGPDSVVIDAATRRQIGDLFDCRDLGLHSLKGLPEPVQAWQVVEEAAVESRFEALHSGTWAPLVGRDEELDLLLRRWQQAKSGNGRAVLLSGEPGIGKSRLTVALSEQIGTEPHTRLRYFCSPHHQNSALYPVIIQLERAAGFERDDGPEAKLDKLETLLGPAAEIGDVSLLVELLSVPGGDRFAPLELSPQRKKEGILAALLRQLEGLARTQPALIIFEDLHWIDPTSCEFLDLVLARIDCLPILLAATFRPEFQPRWVGQAHATVIALNRLGHGDGALMVERLAGNTALLPPDVIAEIVERTDGVPLFLEEMTKAVLEAGVERGGEIAASVPSAGLGVPATLQASLMARLDRLGPAAKGVAQIGAAIGREFSYELVASVGELAEERLQDALQRLVVAGLVFQRGTPPVAAYLFKHALVQDTAYNTLLRGPRRQLHARIAEAFTAHYPELMDSQPELFAQHYAEAGLIEKSAAYWGKAGHSSAARSAMAEAAAQFQKGLDQLGLLPDSPERQRQELEFCSALGAVLRSLKGSAAPELGRVFARARELWEQLGFPSEFLHITYLQSRYHVYRGELGSALHLDDELLRLSRQRSNDLVGLILGHTSSGLNLMAAGRFASSRSHLEAALALCDPISHRSLGNQVGIHPYGSAYPCLGIVLLCLGFPDQALTRSSAAIAEARRLAHAPTLVAGLAWSAKPLALIGDKIALNERATQMLAVATEHGFARLRAVGTIFRGWVKVENGAVAEGVSLMRTGWTAYRATGAEGYLTDLIALLARACEIAGQIEEAMTHLNDAMQIAESTGERWLAAELYRYKGQLLLRQGHSEAAEELYRKALSIAKAQEAKLWELRAAVSLARLWGEQGRRAAGRDLLAHVYGWFTEGFDTADLKEAKALIDELA